MAPDEKRLGKAEEVFERFLEHDVSIIFIAHIKNVHFVKLVLDWQWDVWPALGTFGHDGTYIFWVFSGYAVERLLLFVGFKFSIRIACI